MASEDCFSTLVTNLSSSLLMLLPHLNEVGIRFFPIQAYSKSLREYSTNVHDKDICTVNKKYPSRAARRPSGLVGKLHIC